MIPSVPDVRLCASRRITRPSSAVTNGADRDGATGAYHDSRAEPRQWGGTATAGPNHDSGAEPRRQGRTTTAETSPASWPGAGAVTTATPGHARSPVRPRLAAGGWRPAAGGRRLAAGGWRPAGADTGASTPGLAGAPVAHSMRASAREGRSAGTRACSGLGLAGDCRVRREGGTPGSASAGRPLAKRGNARRD